MLVGPRLYGPFVTGDYTDARVSPATGFPMTERGLAALGVLDLEGLIEVGRQPITGEPRFLESLIPAGQNDSHAAADHA